MKDLPIEQKQSAITPMQVIQQAVASGADVEKLGQLMQLQERWEANEARKAFAQALTAFKSAGITVRKNRKVAFGQTKYNHATLDNVCDVIGEELIKHGLSFRWHTEQKESKVKVTCVLMHTMGHSESVSLESSPDGSGSKNSIQAIGSAVTYLQRYTLLAITGTATGDDDDGKFSDFPDVDAVIEEMESADSSEAVTGIYNKTAPHVKRDIRESARLSEAKNKALAQWAKGGKESAPEQSITVHKTTAVGISAPATETITPDQAIALDDALSDAKARSGNMNVKAEFMEAAKISRLSDLPAAKYAKAMSMIQAIGA